jgi:hypothetical protein
MLRYLINLYQFLIGFKVAILKVIRSFLVNHDLETTLLIVYILLLAVLAVPHLNLIYLLHAEVIDILGALGMHPSAIDTLFFSHLAGNHEV